MAPGASRSARPSLQQTAPQMKSSKRGHNSQHGRNSPAPWLGTADLVSARPAGTRRQSPPHKTPLSRTEPGYGRKGSAEFRGDGLPTWLSLLF